MNAADVQPYGDASLDIPARQCFQHSHTSLGAAGHWIKMGGILAPLVIGEIVKDPDQRWRLIRLSSVATALVAEGLWQQRVRQRKEERAHSR